MADSKPMITEAECKAMRFPVSWKIINQGREILYQDPEEIPILTIAKEFINFLKEHRVLPKQKRKAHVKYILVHPENLGCIQHPTPL